MCRWAEEQPLLGGFESLELKARILPHPVAWLFYPRQSLNILRQQGLGEQEEMQAKVLKWAGMSGKFDRRPPPYAWSQLKGKRALDANLNQLWPGHLSLCRMKQDIFAVTIITYSIWKVPSLSFQHEQMINGLRRVSVHAGVLGCKEPDAAKPDSHSILDYMPGEQPFDGFEFSRERACYICIRHCHVMSSIHCIVVACV